MLLYLMSLWLAGQALGRAVPGQFPNFYLTSARDPEVAKRWPTVKYGEPVITSEEANAYIPMVNVAEFLLPNDYIRKNIAYQRQLVKVDDGEPEARAEETSPPAEEKSEERADAAPDVPPEAKPSENETVQKSAPKEPTKYQPEENDNAKEVEASTKNAQPDSSAKTEKSRREEVPKETKN